MVKGQSQKYNPMGATEAWAKAETSSVGEVDKKGLGDIWKLNGQDLVVNWLYF